jgi:hypothetical protein
VTARAEGAVDEGLAGLGIQDLDELLGQNGQVIGRHIRKVR